MANVSVTSDITGNVWKILVREGDKVEEDDTLIILESMKMEIPVTAPESGTILEICVSEEQAIAEGDVVAILAS